MLTTRILVRPLYASLPPSLCPYYELSGDLVPDLRNFRSDFDHLKRAGLPLVEKTPF